MYCRSIKNSGLWVLAAVAVLLIAASPVSACPTCKDSLAQGPNAMNLVRGYFWSIVFMMSMPFLILAGLSSYFYWEVRKARARGGVTGTLESASPGVPT